MSKIGRKAVMIPAGVTITIEPTLIKVVGPKGNLDVVRLSHLDVVQEADKLTVTRHNEERQTRANHGLQRSLLNNAVTGVTKGYAKTLKLIGTGYRVAAKGRGIQLSVGFSHPVEVVSPSDQVILRVEGNDTVHVEGIDKHMVGQVAANIRDVRPPEIYKGKGIRYLDEYIKLKPGKTAGK